jgi:Rps23 Pro-64 3,4-dihydroxylase Tpa1-like proline 4-hydroxylase
MQIDKISLAKEQLYEKGYCSFNLKEFDESLYDFVYTNRPKDFESQKEHLTRVRIDIFNSAFEKDNIFDTNTFVKDFDTFDEAEKHIKYAREKYKKEDIFQVWYCGNSKPGISNEVLFKPVFNKIARYFYDIKPLVDLHFNSQYTMYNKGCFLQNHKDGQTAGRICVILIYLNENYDKENGGLLVLDNGYEVVPELGNIAILDLGKFDVYHEVTEIIGDVHRFCALSFVAYSDIIKEQQMKYELEKNKNG